MLDQRRVAAQPDAQRERLFTERYDSLLGWAMILTNQQREAAEDLVQDAFVQFMLGRTRLEEIENIDGYLRRMLRYMHVSRLSRSAQHLHETALSVADYDSGRLGWTAIEPPRRMQAFEELHQICSYACSRKESSRAGSVFILRFFHEYFPTEIAAVINSSRHCVDQWQRLARREAKLFIDEPRRLRFVNTKTSTDRQQIRYLKSDCDLMLELRQMIFNSCQGNCLSQSELKQIYTEGHQDALTTSKLAHIVSCHGCLDAVNGVLGLPSLANRYRTDTHEPKEPPDYTDGGGASGGGSDDLTSRFEHRLRETHEHKPHELRIAVNGTLVSSLKVRSDVSELNLNLTPDDPVEFVEVTSEQGMQLLFFSIDPAVPQPDQWAWIELSEGRSLEASFENENGPTLHVIYKDPVPAEALITGDVPTNGLSSPLFVVPAVDELQEPNVGARNGESGLRSWVVRLLNTFRKTAGRCVVAEESPTVSSDEKLISTLERAPFLSSLSQAEDGIRFWQRPGLVIALVCAVVIGGFLFFKARVSRTLTASVLLEKASVADNDNLLASGMVIHRVVTLEERRSAEGAVVARYKIDTWTSRVKGERVQRLYDESNRLIAGAWQKADGSRTTYHHGTKPQSQPALTSPESLLFNLEDVWQLEPAPETFAKLIADTSVANIEERATTYIVSFDKGRAIGASRLVKATLTLSKSNLHAIEQSLIVQRGDDELREYRFGEASLESASTVEPKVFEIESTLTGGAGETGSSGDWAIRNLTTSRVPPTPSTSAPPTASAELEVDVAYLLNQAKADRNEQVALTRSAGGSLRVEGVVDTQERKEEFLQALAPVSNNPAVKIEIRTVAEATTQRHTATGSLSVQEVEETANTIAAEENLRAYFAQQNLSGSVDEAIHNYSSRLVNRAYRALFHAIELKKLMNRFANVDMRVVTPDARSKWLAMLRQHAAGFERETAMLREEMEPVFFAGASALGKEEVSIQSDAELARAVEKLHQMALFNNEAIRSAFTISTHSSAATIKSSQFRRSLTSAENLATRIGQYER